MPSARQWRRGGASGASSNVLVVIVVDVWVRHCGSRRSRSRGLEIQVEENWRNYFVVVVGSERLGEVYRGPGEGGSRF